MSKAFFGALAAATCLPLFGIPLLSLIRPVDDVAARIGLFPVVLLGAYGHVLATAWFGADRDYAAIMRAHPLRMFVAPLALALGLGAVTFLYRPAAYALAAVYLVWQAHHYGRQNFGILSFAAAREGLKLPPDVGLVIHLTTAAGAALMVTNAGIYAAGHDAARWLTPRVVEAGLGVAAVSLLAALALSARLLARSAELRAARTVVAFLALSLVFYLPGFMVRSPPILTFMPFALAHGLQYLVFMAVTVRGAAPSPARLALFCVGVPAAAVIPYSFASGVPGMAYTGLVVGHFLADARLWRLRDPGVREIVRRRFGFLWTPEATPLAAGSPLGPRASR